MSEIANRPLEGVVVGQVTGYELTIDEYEDMYSLGIFPTRELALIALGEYALAHGDVALRPRIIEQMSL